MIGYVYKTTNIINGKMYIGKHKGKQFDNKYYGSGLVITQAIKKYGKKNFIVTLMSKADTLEELDWAEIQLIAEYKNKYGRFCYNQAKGGEGGNAWEYKTEEEKKEFCEKMTIINKERCSSPEFKKKLSEATKQRYTSKEEKEKHRKKITEAWNNEELRKAQSERIKNYYKDKERDCSHNFKACLLIFNGETKRFDSVKDLRKYLKDELNYNPDRRTFHKWMDNGSKNIPFKHFHTAQSYLDGMIIKYENKYNDDVTTNRDECSGVGVEISTTSKDEAR